MAYYIVHFFIHEELDPGFLIKSFIGALLLILMYGRYILLGFILYILIVDFLLFYLFRIGLKPTLAMEWILLAIPFVYYSFYYDYDLWLFLLLSFAFTQFLRYKWFERKHKDSSTSSEPTLIS